MRKTLRWALSFAVIIGAASAGTISAGAVTSQDVDTTDIKEKLLDIEGMSFVEEKPEDGYRYFVLNYEQPVDHRKPDGETFKQRISILHKSEDRPNVFFTSGYGLNTEPTRSEPTRIVDGNQVSMEYRFFDPSRPDPADWTKLDIWQAASDQHRIFTALNEIYDRKWVSTGGSKGGMTATYYRRFYPQDMDGTVAYVAPHNIDNDEDSAYDEFFENVSTKECREALGTVERELFERRDAMVERLEKEAKEEGYTFELIGSADKAFEVVGLDVVWAFWQYGDEAECDQAPGKDATDDELYDYVNQVYGFAGVSDESLSAYTPYYYQAGTQLGQPTVQTPHLDDFLLYPGINEPRTFVPRDIPMTFEDGVMADVDTWVRKESSEMLFVNGENDPWSAEPFRIGDGSEDAHLFVAPGANHGANIEALEQDDRAAATRALLRWAGLDLDPANEASASAVPKPLAKYNAKLDKPMVEKRPLGLP